MKRLLKPIAYVGATVLVLAAILPLLFEDAIGQRALVALRAQLNSELTVAGTSLSLLRDFPYASIGLTDLELKGYPTGTLLKAERLSGRISYYDLLFEDGWVINTVKLENASVEIFRNAARQGNWQVFKASESSDSTSQIDFALSRILLDEVSVSYIDEATQTEVSAHLADGELAGNFGTEAYTLTGSLSGLSHFLSIGDLRYISDMTVAANFELDIAPDASSYTFGESTISLDEMPIAVSGTIGFIKGSTAYNLALATDNGRLGSLLHALPADWVTPSIRSLDTQGDFLLNGTITGLHDARRSPAIGFTGELRNGSLLVPALDRKATGVSFLLAYSNGGGKSMADSELTLSAINAELDGQPVNGSFVWRNFNDPLYRANVTGTIPLSWFDELWDEGEFQGELGLRSVSIEGRQRHLTDASQARHIKTSGSIVPLGVRLNYHDEAIRIEARDLALVGAALHVKAGKINGLGDNIATDLVLENFVPYLFGDEKQTLVLTGEVSTETLDLAAWVALLSSDNESSASASGAEDVMLSDNTKLAERFAARLQISAKKLTYNEVNGSRFQGTCTLKDSDLRFVGEGYAMEGHWSVDGTMELRRAMSLSAKLGCSEVNITELFQETENVGQDIVNADHLEGQMTARVYVEADWDSEANLLSDKLHVWANVGLTDGALKEFEMLQALKKFIRPDELRKVRFTDVENWIEIENGTVYLPAMFIQSTATNFTLAGEHSFEHDIDYSIRVNGAQVIFAKVLGKPAGNDFMPDKRAGFIKTGFKIDGTLNNDNYDVRMANGDVRRHFNFSQKRKASIRRKLTALFGAESLIDDYDDDGERIAGRPQRSRAITRSDANTKTPASANPTASPRVASNLARKPALIVDDAEFIDDWEDDDTRSTARKPATSGTSGAALSGAGRSGAPRIKPAITDRASQPQEPTPQVAEKPVVKPKPATISPKKRAPAENDGGDFMEGFDDVKIPD